MVKESAGDAVQEVILYGSVARHEEVSESDVDLLIISQNPRTVHRALIPILGQLMKDGAPVVSTLILTPEDFGSIKRRQTPFYSHLEREGETLVA